MTVIVKTDKDALTVKLGGSYVIDVWPNPPVTDEEAETLEKRMTEAQAEHDRLQAIIDANIAEPENPMLADVRNLAQEQFVKKYKKPDTCNLAVELGVFKNKTAANKFKEAEVVARIYEAVKNG